MKHDLITLDDSKQYQADSPDGRQFLSFRTHGERYALPINSVREITEYRTMTPVPMMPAFVRGVINLRGHVVPVIDLACRFGLGVTEPGKRTCVIIMDVEATEGEALRFGLMVDAVDSVFDIEDNLEPPPRFGTGLRADFIAGMVREDAGFIIILDITRVLSVDDMKRLASAASSASKTLGGYNGEDTRD
ncbi:chemotaxis protein CheW [Marinobacter adhaerens]|uniref:chemotaxis protein CheW n=1 Tax=Marinobacter adhaerens TaxID=1033846 RepID=UPI001E63BE2D|nr:chemotaxis protein CheW [Marinobacter adhaerens]MCD1646499.1 chemotaxis protein CheW [Marinobacter adhaerens]